jgi:hypothetical protein
MHGECDGLIGWRTDRRGKSVLSIETYVYVANMMSDPISLVAYLCITLYYYMRENSHKGAKFRSKGRDGGKMVDTAFALSGKLMRR